VKTGADPDWLAVDTIPIPITVLELTRVPRPAGDFPSARRVRPIEVQTFLLRARLARVIAEDDRDIHLVLRDLEDDNSTVVAEIPDSACTANAPLGAKFVGVRSALRGVPRDGLIEIVGVGFFDFLHGQSGMSANGIEIHPVTELRVVRP
jgi:hypothetical protein